MSERQGSLMRHRADCGHWMVCYSLEPTPAQCPDCLDELRKSVKLWGQGIQEPLDVPDSDVRDYFEDGGDELPAEALAEMERIAMACEDAAAALRRAEMDFDILLEKHFPAAERLVISEAS